MARQRPRLRTTWLAALAMVMQLLATAAPSVRVGSSPLSPDFTTCGVHAHSAGVNCCTLAELMHRPRPVAFIEWAQYVLDNPAAVRQPELRLRRAAHLPEVAANRTYLRQLDLAFRRMKALPAHDPRSLSQQNKYHCMYGGIGVTQQLGFPGLMYNIHFSWLFWPYHRMFTFFFERILANLVGDDRFALPFWNWDNQAPPADRDNAFLPNALPLFMRDQEKYPGLFDPRRHPRHQPGQPPAIADLVFDSDNASYIPEEDDKIQEANNEALRKYIVEAAAASGPEATGVERYRFLGYPIRAGDEVVMARDTFETMVHGKIHMWLGDQAKNGEDMGQGYAAVLDPIFFMHHANVDRIWSVWQKELGQPDFQDPDYLNAEMFFYDEHAQLVRATVADCLAWSPLISSYQEVDNSWLDEHHDMLAATVSGVAGHVFQEQ